MYDRRSDYAFFRDLGMRVGQQAYWPPRLEDLWDEMLQPVGLNFAELSSRPQNGFDDTKERIDHDVIDPLRPQGVGFATPSGKVELAPSILTAIGADPLPRYVAPPWNTQDEKDYPLILMTGATQLDMTHQDHRQIASLRRRHPPPVTRMHPDTGAKSGLVDGDWVWLESAQGRIRQMVQFDCRIPMDTVDAERWWYSEHPGAEPDLFSVMESNVNVLTPDAPELCDPIYGAWPFREARCRLVKC